MLNLFADAFGPGARDNFGPHGYRDPQSLLDLIRKASSGNAGILMPQDKGPDPASLPLSLRNFFSPQAEAPRSFPGLNVPQSPPDVAIPFEDFVKAGQDVQSNIGYSWYGYPPPGAEPDLTLAEIAKRRPKTMPVGMGLLNFDGGMTPLQIRARMATLPGYGGEDAGRFYRDLLLYSLFDDKGQLTSHPLEVERQYATNVLGVKPRTGSTESFLSALVRGIT